MPDVICSIDRVEKELVQRFQTFSTATIHEAYGRKGAMDPRIKPVVAGMRVCGPAVTVRCHPGDNLMLLKAIDIAQPGDVLVADMGLAEEGPWGELASTAAKYRGLGGLVMNACVRDAALLGDVGFPVFCMGRCIKGTVKQSLGTINHPICCGGVTVAPGDLVIGDDDGVVVVPRNEASQVLARAALREQKESRIKERLMKGESLFQMLGLDEVFQKQGGTIG